MTGVNEDGESPVRTPCIGNLAFILSLPRVHETQDQDGCSDFHAGLNRRMHRALRVSNGQMEGVIPAKTDITRDPSRALYTCQHSTKVLSPLPDILVSNLKPRAIPNNCRQRQ